MKHIRKTAVFAALLLALAFWAPSVPRALAASPARTHASLGICVSDALTGAPVAGADVCFPEAGLRVRTDADGYTRVVRVPYRASGADLAEGTATVVILREGYIPMVCEVRTLPTVLRAPVRLSVYPAENGSPAVLSMVEAPSESSLARLLGRARALVEAAGDA